MISLSRRNFWYCWFGFAPQTRLSNSQLPTDPQFNTLTTYDLLHPGCDSLGQNPGTTIKVLPNTIGLSAPLNVPVGYTLVFPPGPPGVGQTTITWSQPDVNNVVTGTWE